MQSVQRYKFESNSQLDFKTAIVTPCCCNQYKDTNLKAIHNGAVDYDGPPNVVAISTKIQIWKQFTTRSNYANIAKELLQSVQRYKFESNSQPISASSVITNGCCNQYKDTNLKAIHNGHGILQRCRRVVAISTKIQIWKQFTTRLFVL